MSSGPVIPGNRVYPGTSQHWTYGQRILYSDFLKAAILLTLGILAFAGALGLVTGAWP